MGVAIAVAQATRAAHLARERVRDRARRAAGLWSVSTRQHWNSGASGPACGEVRLLVELLNDAAGLAAWALRRRESDLAPLPEHAAAWRWLFDPEPLDLAIAPEDRLPSLTFAAVALALGADEEGLRLRLEREVRRRVHLPRPRKRIGGTAATSAGHRRFKAHGLAAPSAAHTHAR